MNATDSVMNCWLQRISKTALSIGILTGIYSVLAQSDEPFIFETEVKADEVIVSAHVPAGYQSAVLEISNDVSKDWLPIVAGQMAGEEGIVTFRFPDNEPSGFMRVRAGFTAEIPNAPYSGSKHFKVDPGFYIFPEYEDADVPPFGLNPVWSLNQSKKIGHLLNRIGYGPQLDDVTQIEKMGIEPGSFVRLTTKRGGIVIMVRADRSVAEEMVFLPFTYVEAAANILTNSATDPFGKIPEFKFSAVRVEKEFPKDAGAN